MLGTPDHQAASVTIPGRGDEAKEVFKPGFFSANSPSPHQQVVESLLLLMIGTCPGQGVERRYNFLVRALRGDYNGL